MRGSLGRLLLIVGGLTFVVAVAAVDARATYGARTSADEPQYLLTALSLGNDLDLDISDEIENDEFLPFHEINLNQQTIPLNEDGQRISPHDPLLPMVLAIPMALGGWVAAKVALAVLGALTAALTLWVAVRRFGIDQRVAALVVGSAFVAPPLTSYANQVYPELPAALCVVAAFAALTGAVDRRSTVVTIVAVVALPWLAVKYAPVAAVLALALLWRLRSDRRELNGVLAAFAVMGIAYLLLHQRIYGGWTVYAAGDHFVDGELLVVGRDPQYLARSRRLLGLLVDRGFGLGAWTPSLLLLPAALTGLVRRRMPGTALLVSTFLVGWAVATWVALTMQGWWWPGRQVVVVLPLGVIAMALLADRVRALLWPMVGATLLGTASWLWLVFEASTDRRTIIVDFEETANPWYRLWSRVLPQMRDPGLGDWLLYAGWGVLLVATCVVTWRRLASEPSAEPQPASAISSVAAGR